jgi:hypothetical protein
MGHRRSGARDDRSHDSIRLRACPTFQNNTRGRPAFIYFCKLLCHNVKETVAIHSVVKKCLFQVTNNRRNIPFMR